MIRTLSLSLFLLGLGLAVEAGSPAGLSKEEIVQLINHDAQLIRDLLAKPKLDAKRILRVKTASWMVAAYAQEGGMVELRQKALTLLETVEKNAAEAKKLAAELKPGSLGGGSGVALSKKLGLETVMKMYAGERFGGSGMEKALEDLIDAKGPLEGAKKTQALILANKISVLAIHVPFYAPEKDEGTKTQKAWRELAKAMQGASGELAVAVRKNSGVSEAAMNLSNTCVKCHDVFRTPP